MSVCSVVGCYNRKSRHSTIKLFLIPRGIGTFHVNRRQLWAHAITKANDGTPVPLRPKSFICSNHFISGEPSLDFDSPDFVPSVFTSAQPYQNPELEEQRVTRSQKRGWSEPEEKTLPLDDPTLDVQSSNTMETENEVTEEEGTPPKLKKSKMFTDEEKSDTESKVNPAETTPSSPNNSLSPSSSTLPANTPQLFKRRPIVLLRPLLTHAGGFQCELCSQTFSSTSMLVKHKQLHEEKHPIICEVCGKSFTSREDFTEHQVNHPKLEPSFSCNMCDRSFPKIEQLKRHKLLHVRDGRKCLQCGVLFCQRHNHILFRPQTHSEAQSEEELSSDASVELSIDVVSEEDSPKEATPSEPPETTDGAQTPQIIIPLLTSPSVVSNPVHREVLPVTPSASHIFPEGSKLLVLVPALMPPPPLRPLLPKPSTYFSSSIPAKKIEPDLSAVKQEPVPDFTELPSLLKMFSPHLLTSALLDVKRDFDYIFSKPIPSEPTKIVKKEESGPVRNSRPKPRMKPGQRQRIAYDLEIEL